MALTLRRVLLTLRLNIDVLGVLFLSKFSEPKSLAVLIYVGQNMCVLITTQPFILPVESQRLSLIKKLFKHRIIVQLTGIDAAWIDSIILLVI